MVHTNILTCIYVYSYYPWHWDPCHFWHTTYFSLLFKIRFPPSLPLPFHLSGLPCVNHSFSWGPWWEAPLDIEKAEPALVVLAFRLWLSLVSGFLSERWHSCVVAISDNFPFHVLGWSISSYLLAKVFSRLPATAVFGWPYAPLYFPKSYSFINFAFPY